MEIKRVLVVDDHELLLFGIERILIEKFALMKDQIELLTNPDYALKKVKETEFDLYILDLEVQAVSGFDIIHVIREKNPDARIIVYTMHDEVWNINRLLEMNVNGIVLKKSSKIRLEQAIRSVQQGESYFCPEVEKMKRKSMSFQRKSLADYLTERELEILQYIADGHTSKDIAARLSISENAVENHRKNLFQKFNVDNVVKLVRKAIYYHLVEIEVK